MPIKTEWKVVNLDDVVDFFTKAFKCTRGKIVTSEAFIDAQKGKVVFAIMIDEPEDNRPG